MSNTSKEVILIPKATPLGWFISTDFHDFELGIPILGRIPPPLLPGHQTTRVVYTKPRALLGHDSRPGISKSH